MKWFGILGLLLTLALCQRLQAQTAAVTWTTSYQTMDGWGGETWRYQPTYSVEQMSLFFSTSAGIGYDILRTNNQGCAETGPCTIAPSTMHEFTTIQNAVSLGGVSVELSLSPPANLKYSGDLYKSTIGADGSCVDTSNFSALAAFTVHWIQMMQTNGVPVTYLFPFNEPDLSDGGGHCQWNAAGIDAYIKVLGPAMASAGLSSIQIGITDNADWFSTDLVSPCLNDATCAQYVSIVSAHGYGSNGSPDGTGTGYCCAAVSAAPTAAGSRHIWMGEINGGFSFKSAVNLWNWDPSMADAMLWARNLHDYLTIANVSAYEYWELADCCQGEDGVGALNDGLSEFDGATVGKRYYVIGQWSRFVRPGWVRIGATANPAPGVYLTAFNQPSSGEFAIIAINNGSNAAVTFSLSGFPTSPSSVTPWTTSGSLNLAQQPNVSVNQASFTYTLPASSVTSFVGKSPATEEPRAPTELTAVVH